MLICLDVGNTHVHGGIFQGETLSHQFRFPSRANSTSDEIGIFLRAFLRENDIASEKISKVAICSVVPSLDYSLRSAIIKYFSLTPFILQPGVKTGLQIKYKNPLEVGVDRIANAIAVSHLFPRKNVITVDLGSATSFEAISANGEFLGGAILPGLQMQMLALHKQTASLPPVQILKPSSCIGKSTMSNIQAGLFFGQQGAIKEIIAQITKEVFQNSPPFVVGTGGFANLYEDSQLFNSICPELVLIGLRLAYEKNN